MTIQDAIQYRVNINGAMFRMKKADGTWGYLAPPVIAGGDPRTWGRFSGQWDINKLPIFEGDICEVDIALEEIGSMMKGKAMMMYSPLSSAYYFEIINDAMELRHVTIFRPVLIGDVYTHPEDIFPELKNANDILTTN